MVLSLHGAITQDLTRDSCHQISRLCLIPLVSAYRKGDLKDDNSFSIELGMRMLTHGCSTKLLQSHACPEADLLTRSHEPDVHPHYICAVTRMHTQR